MEWTSTRTVLTSLERLLTCGLCEDYLTDPCSLENCDHNFCRECIEKKLGSDSQCPDCGVFSWLKDLRPSHQLATTVTLTLKLRSLIGSTPKEHSQSESLPGNTIIFNSLNHSLESCNLLKEPTTETNLPLPSDEIHSERRSTGNEEMKDVVAEKMVVKSTVRKETLCPQEEHVNKYLLRKRLKRNIPSLNGKALDITNEQSDKDNKHQSSTSNEKPNKCAGQTRTRQQFKRQRSQEPAQNMSIFTGLQAKVQSSGKDEKSCHKQNTSLRETTNKSGDNDKEPTILEEKRNTELNVKRRRFRKRTNSNIKQYLVQMENLDTSSQNSKHCTPHTSKKTVFSTNISPSQNTRNKRGETTLHLAAIKGDILLAQQLINEGADSNAKDNAGWTPLRNDNVAVLHTTSSRTFQQDDKDFKSCGLDLTLSLHGKFFGYLEASKSSTFDKHEACNHGHVDIVKLFLDHGALLNIPGFDNDTPLHDAVANGRLKVVKLLVERGASLTARNKQGLIPKDYAISGAMKDALSPPGASLSQNEDNITTKKCDNSSNGSKVVLGTALNNRERVTLKKCVFLLGGTVVDEFNESVTHVVTPVNKNGHCPRTMKYFSGILTGKWIVSFNWIIDCLKKRKWVIEDDYELQGTAENPLKGPKKTRYNMIQQFPRLFDGCAFFLRGSFNPPTPKKEDLLNLIKLGGGKILQREPKVTDDDLTSSSSTIVTSLTCPPQVAYHARPNSSLSCCTQFIIFDPASSCDPKIIYSPVLCTAPVTWLMDCISFFELLDIPDEAKPSDS